MGSGSWTAQSFVDYSSVTKSRKVDVTTGNLADGYTAQDLFVSHSIDKDLKPYNVMRECRDSEEHPYTVPVILALDVTGSMGAAAAKVATKLNEIMTTLFDQVKDVEFMVMAIGDLDYDRAPIQISQFESDVRIAVQLDKVYFERGGGGNGFESYTAAWYMGARHTDLDCWKRGKKGVIITLGDEPLNPYLPSSVLANLTGDTSLEGKNVETGTLYEEVCEKYDVYHIAVDSKDTSYDWYAKRIDKTWHQYLDDEHFAVVNLDNLAQKITEIVVASANGVSATNVSSEGIGW